MKISTMLAIFLGCILAMLIVGFIITNGISYQPVPHPTMTPGLGDK